MTNYVTSRFITAYIFIFSAVFIFAISIAPAPFSIKIIFYSFIFGAILLGIQSTTIRYTIKNDTLTTKGLGVSNNTINFNDISKAYIFVKTDVEKNSSSNKSERIKYKINKHPYLGLELKNGAVVTLDIYNINKDFFSLLEQKIEEHNIYYFEME